MGNHYKCKQGFGPVTIQLRKYLTQWWFAYGYNQSCFLRTREIPEHVLLNGRKQAMPSLIAASHGCRRQSEANVLPAMKGDDLS